MNADVYPFANRGVTSATIDRVCKTHSNNILLLSGKTWQKLIQFVEFYDGHKTRKSLSSLRLYVRVCVFVQPFWQSQTGMGRATPTEQGREEERVMEGV